jgi:MinD-like ATPase involved in chromosome partitioning or flagellar assembly
VVDPEMVTDCDRGMPFVMAHPDSEATKAFKEIAHRCKEYISLNGGGEAVWKRRISSLFHRGEEIRTERRISRE